MADAQVQQSEAAVQTARINLDYCTIRSPNKRPSRAAACGHRECRGGKHRLAPGDRAAGPDLRGLHYYRERALSGAAEHASGELSKSRCALPDEPRIPREGSSRSWTTRFRKAPARSSFAPRSLTATITSGRAGSSRYASC